MDIRLLKYLKNDKVNKYFKVEKLKKNYYYSLKNNIMGFINHYHISVRAITVSAITGIVHTALALFLWYDSLNYIKVTTASIIAFSDLFFAIILAWLVLGQVPNIYQIIGGILVFFAGVFMSAGEIKGKK
jgi:drug/metabolite transporter (DMT)-like permease